MTINEALKIAKAKYPNKKFANVCHYKDKYIFTEPATENSSGYEVTINERGEEEKFSTIDVFYEDPSWFSKNDLIQLNT